MTPDDWQELAACQAAEPELFFPISTTGPAEREVAQARALCHRCAVRTQCLEYALETKQAYGIWGGLTAEERRPLLLSSPRGGHEALRHSPALP
jgi:WhiB family transcriptional regulator, redox-sensing transcriptional regulator